jgi:hypothetical protein
MKMIKGFQKDQFNTKMKGGENRMLRLMIKTSFLFVLLVSLAIAGNASATFIPTTIGDINANGGYIIIGDKEFSGFSIAGGNIDPFQVIINGSQVGNVVTITFGGAFITTESADYQLNYIVHSLGAPIVSIDQYFNLTSLGQGGTVAIGETVFSQPGNNPANNVAQSSIGFYLTGDYNDPPGEPATGDQLVVNPGLLTLWVTKDINLDANVGGLVGATIIGQSFHQSEVPEPGTLLLLGTGFASLAFYARRRKQ